MTSKIKIAALVHNVIEVSLLGTADLEYWRKKLEPEQLEPIPLNGTAQLLIMAANAKYMGLRFRELSFSVIARDTSGLTDLSGSYLIRAFNSRRSFAWVERTFFHTPYYCDDVTVESEPPSIGLGAPRQRLAAKLDYSSKNPNEVYDLNTWQGPVFIPRRSGTAVADSNVFFARVWNGRVEIPFDQNGDKFSINDASETPCVEFQASNFSPRTWFCGTEATHAKSKTYTRGKCPPYSPDIPFIS
jgi:hypothetical protein